MSFENVVGDLASIVSVQDRKVTSTVAEDALTITNPFTLTDQLKQSANSVGVVRHGNMPSDAMRTDNAFYRSDVVQRNRINIYIDRYFAEVFRRQKNIKNH